MVCGNRAAEGGTRPHDGAPAGARRRGSGRGSVWNGESKMRATRLWVALLLLAAPSARADQHAGEPAGGSGAGAVAPVPAEVQPDSGAKADDGELLSLREALRLALQNNLDIELARYEPRIADQRVDEAEGAYDPLLFSSYTRNHDETPVASNFLNIAAGGGGPPVSVTSIEADAWSWDAGLSGVLPVGIEYSSTFDTQRLETDSPASTLSPEYNSRWVTRVALPLLKDLVTNPLSISVARSRTASERSYEDFQARITDLLVSTEAAYWELTASIANTRVAAKSLQTATELLEQTRVQYEVGVVSRVEVVQAEAGVAQREFEQIAAENRQERAHDRLLNVILAPGERVYEERRVKPEPAVFRDYDVDIQVATAKALELRPELAAARKNVEDAELRLRLAENQLLPSLDLVGRYKRDGRSGSTKDPMSDLASEIDTGSGSATRNLLRADGAESYTVGGEFSIPLGNHTARAVRTQRAIELRRATTVLRREEQTVILDVRNAVRNLRSSIRGIQAAERNRGAQSETLDAEQERLRLGDSTPFQVLEHEQDLAQAERQVIFSLQVHRNAIAGLDRAQATLLDQLGISIARELQR